MSETQLPCPGVSFTPALLARVERCVMRLWAARTRREGSGRGRLAGVGEEFVGYRPYRPGEDLRRLDWNLYARLDQAHIRLTRREASERWAVLLDSSASMGVGPPGKLQRGAELVLALASLGQRRGARVRVVASGGPAGPEVAAPGHLAELVAWLECLEAGGAAGIGSVLAGGIGGGPGDGSGTGGGVPADSPAHSRAWAGGAGRVFLIGDLFDVEPARLGDWARSRRGCECHAMQLLAPVEFAPSEGAGQEGGPGGQGASGGLIEWRDPESGARLRRDLALAPDYERRLEKGLERYQAICAAHGLGYVCRSTQTPFEDILGALLGT